jgi:hypothetical protein
LETKVRSLWIIWAALFAATAATIVLSRLAVGHATPNPVVIQVISLVAASEVIVIVLLRRKLVVPALTLLGTQPDDPSALARWQSGYIATWALSVCIALYGLVLRYLGFDFRQLLPFFIAGCALMVFYTPCPPVITR